MTSIIVAAHNEATVIGRCLDALLREASPGEFDVIVVANGCTDETARIAADRAGVRVLDLATPGKVGALNAGDEVALRYPRIYLDADIVIPSDGIRALCAALVAPSTDHAPRVLASTARREVDVSRSQLPVRCYFAIHARLPVFQNALFGRGVMALSEEGRARFGRFPDVIAEDLFVDSLFAPTEKCEVESVYTTVVAPRGTRDLVRRLTRVRQGNANIRALRSEESDVRAPRWVSTSWLFDVVLRNPMLVPAATCYVCITLIAAIQARRRGRNVVWARDESSREIDDQSRSEQPANDRR
jgi:glycosyltransferase involved in cell wall biosynthesis